MNWWTTFLRAQQEAGFADFTGARASLTLPVSDAVVNMAIAALLPPSGSIRRVAIRAVAGNIFRLRVGLARPAFLPEIPFELRIERQPALPASPKVVLRILSLAGLPGGIAFLLSWLKGVPAGVSLRGDLIEIDLPAVLRRFGVEEALRYITRLNIATEDGIVVLFLEAGVSPTRIDSPETSD